MAEITPGSVFQTGDTVTPALFHTAVDDGFLVNVRQADLVSGVRLIERGTPASPISGDTRVGSDGRLEFYFGGQWITQEADQVIIVVTNRSGATCNLGDVVAPDRANADSFKTSGLVSEPMLGVCMETITNLATGHVLLRGRCQAYVASLGTSGSTVPPGAQLMYSGSALKEFEVSLTKSYTNRVYGRTLQSMPTATGRTLMNVWVGK